MKNKHIIIFSIILFSLGSFLLLLGMTLHAIKVPIGYDFELGEVKHYKFSISEISTIWNRNLFDINTIAHTSLRMDLIDTEDIIRSIFTMSNIAIAGFSFIIISIATSILFIGKIIWDNFKYKIIETE